MTRKMSTEEITLARSFAHDLAREQRGSTLHRARARELAQVIAVHTDEGWSHWLPNLRQVQPDVDVAISAWVKADAKHQQQLLAFRVRDILVDALRRMGNYDAGFIVVGTDGTGGAYYTADQRPILGEDERRISLRPWTLERAKRLSVERSLALIEVVPA
jgi:hypothetical protein